METANFNANLRVCQPGSIAHRTRPGANLLTRISHSPASPEALRTPGNPFIIAHLSDPHLSRQYYPEHIKSFKTLLRTIIEEGCDHIVITGDIVSTADPDDYYLARTILRSYDLLESRKLTIVPGNHDVFGGPHRAVDVLSFPQHIRNTDYCRRLALFEEAFAETFVDVRRLAGDDLFPFVKDVGPFSLIGLNSIPPWSLWNNPLGSNGILSEQQISILEKPSTWEERQGRISLVAMHHHFNDLNDASSANNLWRRIESKTMRMKKRRKVLKLFKALGVQIVLHGHIHRNELYKRNGIRLANGAGAVCDDPIPMLKYNRIAHVLGATTIKIRQLPISFHVPSTTRTFHNFRALESVHQSPFVA